MSDTTVGLSFISSVEFFFIVFMIKLWPGNEYIMRMCNQFLNFLTIPTSHDVVSKLEIDTTIPPDLVGLG